MPSFIFRKKSNEDEIQKAVSRDAQLKLSVTPGNITKSFKTIFL